MAMKTETSFAKWLRECDITATEAARRLGLDRHRVYALARGASLNRPGQKTEPDLMTRWAMRAIAAGLELDKDLVAFCGGEDRAGRMTNRRLGLAITAARRRLPPWPE